MRLFNLLPFCFCVDYNTWKESPKLKACNTKLRHKTSSRTRLTTISASQQIYLQSVLRLPFPPIFHFFFISQCDRFPKGVPSKILNAFLLPHILITCPVLHVHSLKTNQELLVIYFKTKCSLTLSLPGPVILLFD